MSGKRKRTGCRLGVGCGRASSCSCLQFLISSTCFFPAHSSRTGDAHICSQQECWRTGTSCSNYFPKAWPCKHGPWDHGPTQSLDAGKGACKEEKWSQNTASTAEQQGSHCCLPRPPARIVQWGSALPPSFTSRFQERRDPEGGKMIWQVNPQAELRSKLLVVISTAAARCNGAPSTVACSVHCHSHANLLGFVSLIMSKGPLQF